MARPAAVPDMMIGTDSHTPMVNGIGVLGWGVGGLEAQTVMFGMPTMLRIPDVIGVELAGAMRPGVLATDLALTVTQRLRALGVSGEFVEFYGPGVASLSAGERAVVANMAPEYGATTGFFPADERTLDYLRGTGRDEASLALARLSAAQRAVVRPRRAAALHPHAAHRARRAGDVRGRPQAAAGLVAVPGCARRAAGRQPADRDCRRSGCIRSRRGRRRRGPAGLSGGDRGHHQLHQHFRPGLADGGRAARQGARAGAEAARPG